MKKNKSLQKISISLVLFITVGISLGLYYGLDNPNVLLYAIPLDVSSEGIKKILDETEEQCYQDVLIKDSLQWTFKVTLSCYHIDELKKLDVEITKLGKVTDQVPLPNKQFIELPSYQPQCPKAYSSGGISISHCNYISEMENPMLLMPSFISHIPTSSAQKTLDELNKYGQKFYECRGSNWVIASYSATCHGYGALNHQALATVKAYHKPYLLSQYDVLQKLVSIEKKIDDLNKLLDDGSITCNIKSTTVVDYSDGTVERFESKTIQSAIYSLNVKPQSDNDSLKISSKDVKRLTVMPSILCESLPAPVSISKSNLTFTVEAQNSSGDNLLVFRDIGESKLIKINSSDEYEIMRLEIPINSILEKLDFGEYNSSVTLGISGTIQMNFEGLQESNIVIQNKALETKIDSKITKQGLVETKLFENPEIIESSAFYLENSFIEDDWEFAVDKSAFYLENSFIEDEEFAVDKSPTVSLSGSGSVQNTTSPTEAITQFFNYLLSGDFEKLNDEKFLTIYLMILIFIVIGILLKRNGRQYILLTK